MTLINSIEIVVKHFEFGYSLKVSLQFLECADKQLTQKFIAETGLKPSKKLMLTMSANNYENFIYGTYYLPGDNSAKRKLMVNLYVNHNWNPVTILWRSKQLGRDYKLHDENIDCNDIEFWFEKLDTDLYKKQLKISGQKLQFNLDNLSFELQIETIEIESTVSTYLLNEAIGRAEDIAKEVTAFVDDFNEASEKLKNKYGVVHSIRAIHKGDAVLAFKIDLGSSGDMFLKKFIRFLSDLRAFNKVVIDSPDLDDFF